jgi:hypothetical protein
MPAEFFLEMITPVAVMFKMPPTLALYMMSMVFAVLIGMTAGKETENAMVGVYAFIGSLFAFGLIDIFPLWIMLIPTVVIVAVYVYRREAE